MKILIADDDKILIQVYSHMLAKQGHETVLAYNGIEAIDILQKDRFDILITDILMPLKEGIEVIREVRGTNPQMKIIAISSGGKIGLPSFLKIAESFGADASLSKPFTEEQLLQKIEEVIHQAPIKALPSGKDHLKSG